MKVGSSKDRPSAKRPSEGFIRRNADFDENLSEGLASFFPKRRP